MPVQHTFYGRPVTARIPHRRFRIVFGLTLFIAFSIILFSRTMPVDVPAVNALTDHLPQALSNAHLPLIPPAINPFKPVAHKPPEQANSSLGEAKWHIDWRWRHPFSSSVTLDENRAVLPPLKQRPAVYTYYEPDAKQPKDVHEAEETLLLQWRRAWWAQGFKPIVLGRPEAVNNPLYKRLQRMQIEEHMEVELARWLAWGNMGTGILTHWLAYPMAPGSNPLLSFLRRGQYPQLTRFEGLGNGLFCGEKDAVNNALGKVIEMPELKQAGSMAAKVLTGLFTVDTEHNGIAFYDTPVIEKKYKSVAKSLFSSQRAAGMQMLSDLINSHLHISWQESFPSGVAVVKPLPEHMTTLSEPALDIAGNLTQCPSSPEPTSCPPNRPRCKKCVSAQPLPITMPPAFRNKSSVFHIGVVPHPYTSTALILHTTTLNTSAVRRRGMQTRDAWLTAVTTDLVGTGPSSQTRVVRFKEAVAGVEHSSGFESGPANSLWLTAEKEATEDLDWVFGFDVWRSGMALHGSETPVPGPERRPKPKSDVSSPVLDVEELRAQRLRVREARKAVRAKGKREVRVREAVEAWHMADAEAWRFARAYAARRVMERRRFEEEERSFHGAERSRGRWGRWFDRV